MTKQENKKINQAVILTFIFVLLAAVLLSIQL